MDSETIKALTDFLQGLDEDTIKSYQEIFTKLMEKYGSVFSEMKKQKEMIGNQAFDGDMFANTAAILRQKYAILLNVGFSKSEAIQIVTSLI